MKIALVALLAVGCSQPAPKTPESMLAYRLRDGARWCGVSCPVGHDLPYDPSRPYTPVTQCCVDPLGMTWSRCAWNSSGRYMSPEQLMEPSRLAGNCGGDGFPDCGAR